MKATSNKERKRRKARKMIMKGLISLSNSEITQKSDLFIICSNNQGIKHHLQSMKPVSCSRWAILLLLLVKANLALAIKSSHLNSQELIDFSRLFSLLVSIIRSEFTINLVLSLYREKASTL